MKTETSITIQKRGDYYYYEDKKIISIMYGAGSEIWCIQTDKEYFTKDLKIERVL